MAHESHLLFSNACACVCVQKNSHFLKNCDVSFSFSFFVTGFLFYNIYLSLIRGFTVHLSLGGVKMLMHPSYIAPMVERKETTTRKDIYTNFARKLSVYFFNTNTFRYQDQCMEERRGSRRQAS